MNNIAIFGAGGFGREVAMLIEQINANSQKWNLIGFFDDQPSATEINGYKYLGNSETLNDWKDDLFITFAIGNPKTKRLIISKINNKTLRFPTLIHPNVLIGNSKFVNIGEGSIICASNIITVNINIGKHVILNLACTVGHDTVIGDYSSCMPGVNISGEVTINEGVYVGTGAKIINQLEIGSNTIVGAGAVVSKSLPPDCTAVGIPAKPIKYHTR